MTTPNNGGTETDGLTLLSAGPRTRPADQLEAFPNPHPQRAYHIRIESPEFTALCPITGQPDFATITLEYVPGPRCVELKAYKLYLWHFRDQGAFHEDVVNRILDDLVAAIAPRWARVTGVFNVRGGLYTDVVAAHGDSQLASPYPVLGGRPGRGRGGGGHIGPPLPRLREARDRLTAILGNPPGPPLDAGNPPIRVLLSLLFERCATARGCPAPGATALAPAPRAAVAGLLDALTEGCAAWTGRTLGAIYEALLDGPARRQGGIYYTSAPIVEAILAAALDPLLAACGRAPAPPPSPLQGEGVELAGRAMGTAGDQSPLPRRGEGRVRGPAALAALRGIRVLDPACGAGYFLVAAAARLAAALASADPAGRDAAAWLGAACGLVYGADRDPVACDLAHYSLHLAAGGRGARPPAHVWCGDALAGLPAGWADFDAVVGNPPYLAHRAQAEADKAGRRDRYRTARGQYDLSVLFVERGLDLLRPGGVLGYIVPNKFMAADYGAPLRALLARETSLLRLEDVSQAGVFPAAAIYPVILVARKAPPAADHAVILAGPGRPPARLPQAALCGLAGGILPAAATPALLALAARSAAQPGRLPAGAIRCGIARSGAAATAISAAAYAGLTAEAQAAYRPLLRAQDIGPYAVRPPLRPRYLPRTAMTAAQWAAFARPAVLVPGIARGLRAAYTPGGPALGRVYAIAAGATPDDAFALLALLNSRLLAWYYRFLYWPVHLSGGYLRFNGPYLAALPLPEADAAARALAGPARALAADPGAGGAGLQEAIDAAVCALYGVSGDELAAAEASLAALTPRG